MSVRQRILVLGANGMIGHTLFQLLAQRPELEVHGTTRNPKVLESQVGPQLQARIHPLSDALEPQAVARILAEIRPHWLLNCVGMVKQKPEAQEPLLVIPLNALLPHQLARLCLEQQTRLLHFSTDCVFSGRRGLSSEEDPADPLDLYGRSKLLGEPTAGPCVTLRISALGHELQGQHGLLEWFLAQRQPVQGYTRAVFSGLPTFELARVLAEFIFPDPSLSGLFHVAAAPISKFDLLQIIARLYGQSIPLQPCQDLVLDRSMDGSRFERATGYRAPEWPELIGRMHEDALHRYTRFRSQDASLAAGDMG